MTATDFAVLMPKTWVGVYDNVFLEKAAELILTILTSYRSTLLHHILSWAV